MQSIKRLVHAKNNRVWSVKQTSGSLREKWERDVEEIREEIKICKEWIEEARN